MITIFIDTKEHANMLLWRFRVYDKQTIKPWQKEDKLINLTFTKIKAINALNYHLEMLADLDIQNEQMSSYCEQLLKVKDIINDIDDVNQIKQPSPIDWQDFKGIIESKQKKYKHYIKTS